MILLLKKENVYLFYKNNILAAIFKEYYDVWAVDYDRSSIVRNIFVSRPLAIKRKTLIFQNWVDGIF